jgi:hypothetical protein
VIIPKKSGTIHHILPAAVCMAMLEYYAFEARAGNEKAAQSYRTLARKGFTDFIYAPLGLRSALAVSDHCWFSQAVIWMVAYLRAASIFMPPAM